METRQDFPRPIIVDILEETPKVNRKMKIRQAFPNPIIVDASQETPRLYRKMKPWKLTNTYICNWKYILHFVRFVQFILFVKLFAIRTFVHYSNPYTQLSGGSFGCKPIFMSIWQIFFCQMGPLFGVDPGLPFGLYFFPLTSEQLSIIYIKCQEHISEQFLLLSLFCFCWHWWSEGPICGNFFQESKSW